MAIYQSIRFQLKKSFLSKFMLETDSWLFLSSFDISLEIKHKWICVWWTEVGFFLSRGVMFEVSDFF